MAMTYDTRGQRAFANPGDAAAAGALDRARAFRLAGRHTQLVRILRVALPVGAVCVCGLYLLTLRTSWKIGSGRLNVGQIELTADDMTMKNPSYFGVNKDGSRYEIRAKRAVIDLGNQSGPIKLIDVDGDLVQTSKVVTKLKAKQGLLDNGKGELELFDGIEIDASNGLSARMTRAMVYSKEHRVVSKEPVDVTMPTATVHGSTMTMKTDTRESTFVGDVTVRMTASPNGQTPSGFGRDPRQPVDVASEQLYINDTSHTALFTGNVVATQGDTVLKAPEMNATYEGKAADQLTAPKPDAAADAKGEGSRLSRMVASKGAVITAGADRRIAADLADFDPKADTALFVGNVLVNQQKNVLQGRRLFVDRKNNKSRLDSPAENGLPAGRIAATLYQSDGKAAQPAKTKPAAADLAAGAAGGMLGSFKSDPNAPMDIEANTLDIFDATKQAVFRTNVKAQQGDIVIRTVELIAFYTGQAGFGMTSATDDGKTASQLTRVETKEKVLITSKDGQTATGDSAVFDVKANTVLLVGHVVVSRGKDVAEGPRLKIDLTTGMYRFEVESDAAGAAAAAQQHQQDPPKTTGGPAVSSNSAETPTGRTCPPGKQCLLFFPQDAKDRAKGLVKKVPANPAAEEAWKPSTSGSSVIRSD